MEICGFTAKDRAGNVAARFESTVEPKQIAAEIERLL